MVTVDELIKEIEGQSEVGFSFKGSKEQTQKGIAAIMAKPDYSAETRGPDLENKVLDYAVDLYTAMGEPGNKNPKILAHQLTTLLGDNYTTFEEALKIGDVGEANKLVKDALTLRYGNAFARSTVSQINKLSADQRVEVGRALVQKLGPEADDYVLAASNPIAVLNALTGQRRAAYQFK